MSHSIRSIAVLLLSVSAVVAGGPVDPEGERLDSETFRGGLKRLGMTDLLEFYVREFPPQDPVEAALLRRELKLNLYSDPSVDAAERLVAAAQATEIMRGLIEQHTSHPDRLSWRLELGRDLIERKAEPYYNNILLRGGTPEDHRRLAVITAEAMDVFERLVGELSDAIREIDSMSIPEFEAKARSGHIEKIEVLLPKVKYFSMWASYYHCLTLHDQDPVRSKALHEIIDYLTRTSELTTIDHKISHHQAQSLLLAGMAYRLLDSADKAEALLSKAAAIASALPDYTERHNLKWVVTWSQLERIKNARDRGQYDKARSLLMSAKQEMPSGSSGFFHVQFALALLEGTICQQQAESLDIDDLERKEELLLRSREPLIELARTNPRYQDEIYSTIFEMLGDISDPDKLDSFEKSVYIAGMIRRAHELEQSPGAVERVPHVVGPGTLPQTKDAALTRATEVAKSLLSEHSPLARELHPEAHFNLAVCLHGLGEILEAIEQFNAVVEGYEGFAKGEQAAGYSVRLSEAAYSQAGPEQRDQLRPYFLASLRALSGHFPDSSLARTKRYTYARLLQQEGRFEEAAVQYGNVAADQPKYHHALFHVAECNLLLLRRLIGREPAQSVSAQAQRTLASADRFRSVVGQPSAMDLQRYVGESLLISAEVHISSVSKEPEVALEIVAGFDDTFVDQPDLIGRAMRIRIQSLQMLGRLEEAAAIIPGYLRRDPDNAGATLQGLLTTFNDEINAARDRGQPQEARRKAETAVLVARALYDWGTTPSSNLDLEGRLLLKLELGDALLRAGHNADAQQVFAAAVEEDAGRQDDGRARNGRALFGLAEAYYQNKNFTAALEQFSHLYQASPESSEMWWKSFLRDVQCRHGLDQDPRMLYNLIEQKRIFFPDMGGFRQEFQVLQAKLGVTEPRDT